MVPWWWVHVVVVAVGYLLGSIPFSYLVARLRGVDVRAMGSGNVGATNVMRSVGKWAGFAAFALDFVKGSLVTLLGLHTIGGLAFPSLMAVVAVIGHIYPVWLRFRGGKGVATGAGAFLPLAPVATVAAIIIFAVTTALTRYVSLGSVAGTASLAAVAWAIGTPHPVPAAAAAAAALIVSKHRTNLGRLASGTERRLGSRSAESPS